MVSSSALSFSNEDVLAVFGAADNLNSALKHFLKKEIRPGDPNGRFIKDLRAVVASGNTKRLADVVAAARPKFDGALLGVAGYAHSEMVMGVISKVVEKYADSFNLTYVVQEDEIELKDKTKFCEIATAGLALIDGTLKETKMSGLPFLRATIVAAVFERPVLARMMKDGLV